MNQNLNEPIMTPAVVSGSSSARRPAATAALKIGMKYALVGAVIGIVVAGVGLYLGQSNQPAQDSLGGLVAMVAALSCAAVGGVVGYEVGAIRTVHRLLPRGERAKTLVVTALAGLILGPTGGLLVVLAVAMMLGMR